MRVILLLSIVAVVAMGHEDIKDIKDFSKEISTPNEIEFQEASARLSTMIQAGRTSDACVKGGRAAINEVIREKNGAQTVLNKMPNGSKCRSRRAREVRAAKERVSASRTALRTAERNLSNALARRINVSIRFSTGNKNCNNFFNTRVWKNHRRLVKKLKRLVSNGKAKLASSKNGLTIALHEQRKAQCRCKVKVTKNANKALKTAKKLTSGRKRTIRREELLICLAKARGRKNANTLGNSCKSASLPSGYNTKLALRRTKLVKMHFMCNNHRGGGVRQTNDKCKGFFQPKSCHGHIAFELQNHYTWNRYAVYKCPIGWKWASRNEYNAVWKKVRNGGYGKKGTCTGYGYYGRCGWSGYPSGNKYYFRFRDSRNTCSYKHAGNYIASTSTTCSTSHNGGIVCIRA